MDKKHLTRFNRVGKRQKEKCLSYITTANEDNIDKLPMSNWPETHEGLLGKNRPKTIFDMEHPTRGDWNPWR